MSIYYIGIGGVARAGKDSFANSLSRIIRKYNPNKKIETVALSTPLKLDCKDFIQSKLNLDVFTQNSEQKSIFREMLVWYGKVKRQQTHGTYWTGLLDEYLETSNIDICIIPDIRYQQYDKDEVHWLRSKNKNSFFHLKRKLPNGDFQPPANMDEQINDGIISELADTQLIIDTFIDADFELKLDNITKTIYDEFVKSKI